MNQSFPPFSHFTSLLLLCIFSSIVKIEICSCPLSVLPITWNEQALICSLPTSIFVHFVFLLGHFFLPIFFCSQSLVIFSLVTMLCSGPRLSGNYIPSFPSCQILAQTCSASHPVPCATCWLPSLSPPSQATMHGWWHPVAVEFCLTQHTALSFGKRHQSEEESPVHQSRRDL